MPVLDEVLKKKQKDIDVAEAKLKAFQLATDETAKDLTKNRTDLNTLTKQVISKQKELDQMANEKIHEYSVEVKKLNRDVEDLRATINRLDQEIIRKEKLLSEETNTAKEAYEKQEALAHEEHKALLQKIALYDQQLAAAQSRFDQAESRHADCDNREVELDQREEDIKKQEIDLGNERKYFDGEHQNALQNLAHQTLSLKTEESAFRTVENMVKQKEVSANEILRRIHESEELVQKAQGIGNQNKIDRESLNAERVKFIAENHRLALKEEALDKKERELAERENNIKLAEAHIAEKP